MRLWHTWIAIEGTKENGEPFKEIISFTNDTSLFNAYQGKFDNEDQKERVVTSQTSIAITSDQANAMIAEYKKLFDSPPPYGVGPNKEAGSPYSSKTDKGVGKYERFSFAHGPHR
jgi:hypothetical protein